MAGVALGLVALWPQGEEGTAGPALALTASHGAELWNSSAGEPLVGARDWRPGQRVGGTVRIENRSDRPVVLRLSARRFEESGGPLSERTRARVRLVGVHLRPEQRRITFGGKLAELRDTRIGVLRPGKSKRYRIRVRLLPRAGDKYQGARLSFDLRWRSHAG